MGTNIKITETLRTYALFTVNDAAKLIRKSAHYPKIFVSRLVKKGLAARIMRGKYTMQDDPIIFASSLYPPSYIALWSALSFHGMTEQIPKDIFVATGKKRAKINFKGVAIETVHIKQIWGFDRHNYNGFIITVSDKEKTLIDCVLTGIVPLHILYGGIEEKELNIEKLVSYLLRIKNSSLAKRIGWLMDKKGIDISKKLKNTIDSNYIPLEKGMGKAGKKNKKWKIIENTAIE